MCSRLANVIKDQFPIHKKINQSYNDIKKTMCAIPTVSPDFAQSLICLDNKINLMQKEMIYANNSSQILLLNQMHARFTAICDANKI